MNTLLRRALARHLGTRFLKALVGAALVATAFPTTVAAEAAPTEVPLSLAAATELAVANQPLLDAQRHAVTAARESAVAAARLPDPRLVGGVSDVLLSGPERYSLDGDGETQTLVGIKQEFPGGGERRWLGRRGDAQAVLMQAELDEQTRMVRREAALAWLEAWNAVRAQQLLTASIAEAETQQHATDIAYRAGRAGQADVLASRVAVELLQDQLAGMTQDEWHARNMLRRWIGADADRPIDLQRPALATTPDEAALIAALERHPHLAVQTAAVSVAQADVEVARAAYAPDWSIELAYGHRPDLEDMATVQFEIGLPVFRADRQDRQVASRSAELARAESLRADWLKQHRAEIALNVADWNRLQQRFRRYDEVILPSAQQRLDAALAAYGAGRGLLLAVIEARRSLLEIRMQRLELEMDAARHEVQLQYFAVAPAAAPGEPS
jgi:outer membrane protein, heavy metal efflux system